MWPITRGIFFLIGMFFLGLCCVHTVGAQMTNRNIITDFEGDPVYLNDSSSPDGWYLKSTTNGGTFTWQVDPTQGANGTQRSLKMTVTDGVPYFWYLNSRDLNAYINRNTEIPVNRMRFYIKFPQGWRRTNPLAYNYNFHVGTYQRDPTIFGNQETHNWHFYYHLVFDTYDDNWVQVDLGMWSQHQRGLHLNSGINPTTPRAHFYQHFSRVYFTGEPYFEQPQVPYPYDVWFDEWEFYYENLYVTTQPEYCEDEVLTGGEVYYPITITNTHPSEFRRYGLLLNNELFNSDNYWTNDTIIIRDDNGDGSHQSTENSQINETPLLAPNENCMLFIRLKSPSSGAGSNPGAYWMTNLVAWQKEPAWQEDPHLVPSDNNYGISPGTPAVGTQIITHVVGQLSPADTTPPAPLQDLTVAGVGENYVRLAWTATGDDGVSGHAYAYDIRYSTSPIDEMSFAQATPISDEAAPLQSGSSEMQVLPPVLEPGSMYYFAVKTYDEKYQSSGISNVVSGWTTTVSNQPNQPPVANLDAQPTQGSSPLTVTFTGSNSTDSDGSVRFYHWDFGDGSTSDEPDPVHVYDVVGTYQVVLTVQDDRGDPDSASVTVDVSSGASGWIQVQQGVNGYSGSAVNRILGGSNETKVYLEIDWATRTGYHGGPSRLLVNFEGALQSLPPNTHVTEAQLRLFQVENNQASGHVVGAKAILRPFDKYTVSWLTPWSSPGAEGSTDTGSVVDSVLLNDQASVWRQWDVTSIVQQWETGALPNYGILLQSENEVSGYARYAHAGYSDPALRPMLVLGYADSTTSGTDPTNTDGTTTGTGDTVAKGNGKNDTPGKPGKPTHVK